MAFVSTDLCMQEAPAPQIPHLSLCLHLHVGIVYQENVPCKWLHLPFGTLLVLNTLKPYF